jgi:hypothetical protein
MAHRVAMGRDRATRPRRPSARRELPRQTGSPLTQAEANGDGQSATPSFSSLVAIVAMAAVAGAPTRAEGTNLGWTPRACFS